MGCDSSKQEPVLEVGKKKGKRRGTAEHGNGVQAAKGADHAGTYPRVTTVDENRNEKPKILGQSDCNNATKTFNKSVQKHSKQRRSSLKSGGVLNAWDASPRVKARPLKSIEPMRGSALEVRSETEYDKEGIDLYSTSLNVNTSSSPRSSPDGIHVNSENDHKWKVMTKAETEQAFDPSDLIDIKKFKAVNAPASRKTHEPLSSGTADQEYQPDPLVTDAGSRKAGWPASAELASPSNSNFYDEDEKELMANIEKDFWGPQNVLPGAVE